MCRYIYVDDKELTNQGEVRKHFGLNSVHALPLYDGYSDSANTKNCCLCPVDIDKLAKMVKCNVEDLQTNWRFIHKKIRGSRKHETPDS